LGKIISTNNFDVFGAFSDVFIITQFPAAIALMAGRSDSRIWKLNALIMSTTPSGSL
jgi:hypothetical protein